MSQFILFFLGRSTPAPNLTPEQMQLAIERYSRWADSLRKQGKLVSGEKLAEGGRLVQSQNGGIVDGPFAETKETIGGFFIINAMDYAEAVKIARDCPVLGGGGSVEIREIQQT